MTSEELEQSMAAKYMRYELEPGVVDPDNPLQHGVLVR
jgi:hypothetical protein